VRRAAPVLLLGLLVGVGACGDDDEGASDTSTATGRSFADELEQICAAGDTVTGGPEALVPVVRESLDALSPDDPDDQATLATLIDLFDEAEAAIDAGRTSDAEAHIEEASSIVRDQGATCGAAPSDPSELTQPDAVIDIGGKTTQLTADGDDVWVTDFDDPVVTRVRASTGEVLARITVDDHELRTVHVAADGVWVRGAAAMHRIDPATDAVVATVRKDAIGTGITRVFVDDDVLWACSGRTIIRADRQGTPTATTDLGFPCGTVTSAAGQVWVASDEGPGHLVKLDPATGAILLTTDLPIDLATFPSIDAETVWTHSQAEAEDLGFVAVDASTGELLFEGSMDAGSGPGALGASRYYAAAADLGEVLVIDRSTGEVVERLAGGRSPNAVALSDGHLWVVDDSEGQLRRFDL
jgi:hypothetical protein